MSSEEVEVLEIGDWMFVFKKKGDYRIIHKVFFKEEQQKIQSASINFGKDNLVTIDIKGLFIAGEINE